MKQFTQIRSRFAVINTTSNAIQKTVILVSGPSVPGYFGDALSFDGVSGGVVLPERYQWNLDLTGNRVNRYKTGRDPRVFPRR